MIGLGNDAAGHQAMEQEVRSGQNDWSTYIRVPNRSPHHTLGAAFPPLSTERMPFCHILRGFTDVGSQKMSRFKEVAFWLFWRVSSPPACPLGS